MRSDLFFFLLVALLTFAVPAAADEQHPLVRSLALTDSEAAKLSATEIITAADWLKAWSILENRAPVTGSTEKYLSALRKAQSLYRLAQKKDPQNPKALWKHAAANYMVGELLPSEDKKQRIPLYEEMLTLTERCFKITEKEAGCWHYWAVGAGRLGTTRGIVSSMRVASDLEDAWNKAIELEPKDVHVWGDPMLPGVYNALGIFYRLVPDMWIVKVVIGTRGDKEKSVAMMRKAAAAQPYRLELQKELGVALVCLGTAKDNPKALAEGKALFQKILAGEFDKEDIRATDAIDKRHVADMLKRPELACKYSRDGYQEIDEAAARRELEKK